MKLKEFLSVREIGFDSVNVLDHPTGLADLRALGARSVPVLSRGTEWVFAQNIGHVVKFLGLNEKTGPVLSPDQLVARTDLFLATASRLIRQMPDAHLATEVPNRPRAYKLLAHHIFQIQDVFLDMAGGATLTYEQLGKPPPENLRGFEDIAAFGEQIRARMLSWWAAKADKSGKDPVQTYYGPQILHETMERATWHSGQHVRQWAMLLEMAGISPDKPLTSADYADLPMPANAWDG
ncbi:MAG: DinB family protein [Acetobacteraceae bacterium]|nr:DinB family protein [Acetobacteraceae bacterium]